MRRVVLVSVVLALLPAAVAAQKRGLLPADYYKEVTTGEAAVSPDGTLVAFTVTTVVEKENKRHREIWLARVDDRKPFRFTDPTYDSSGPRWSPAGDMLAFTSRRGKDTNSIWFARVTAPGGEAFHIEGVTGSPIWSPDGKWIAFAKTPGEGEEDEAAKKNEREGWIAPDSISKTLDAKRFDGRVVTSTRLKRDGTLTFLPHPATRKKTQLFVVPAEGGPVTQVTKVPFDVGGVVWAADSRLLFFSGDEKQDDEYNEDQTSDLFVVSREGGEPRKLTPNPGGERAPAVASDGSKLAFLYTKERGAETDVMVVDLNPDGTFKGQPKNLTPAWDLQPGSPEWTPEPTVRAVHFSAGIGGNVHQFELSLDGQIRQMTRGDFQLSGFSTSKDGGVRAYSVSDPMSPSEVYLVSARDGKGGVFTSFNKAWLADVDLVPPERLTWKVKDGSAIEGWLVKPVGYTPGKKYPLVIKIHGGPHGAYGNVWFSTFHILSGSGMFVLYTNPRGSTGYGHTFTYATRGKWGELDSEDFLAGIDTAMKKYPDIDGARLGVSGGSYGGYMTNWLTATTKRFAAAVTSRSITNWESWYGASDAQGLTEYEFLGKPWEARDTYRRLSPISYVENVTAATLIISGENDYRTPISEDEQWFMALKKRKVPVEQVRYPRSSHGLSRTGEPWLLVDRLERIRSWFVYWLVEKPAK